MQYDRGTLRQWSFYVYLTPYLSSRCIKYMHKNRCQATPSPYMLASSCNVLPNWAGLYRIVSEFHRSSWSSKNITTSSTCSPHRCASQDMHWTIRLMWVGIGCNFSLGSLNVKFVELWLYEDLKVYHCILRCWLPTSPICTCTWSFWACFIFFRICIYTLYNYIDEERNITTRHLVVSRVQTQDPFRLLLLQAVSFLGMLYTWCCPSLLEGK